MKRHQYHRWLLLVFILGLGYVCVSATGIELGDEDRNGDEYNPGRMDSLLINAFESEDSRRLDSFFGIWKRKSRTSGMTAASIYDDTLRAICALFRDFYSPDSVSRMCKYFVLQDSISFGVLDSNRFSLFGKASTNIDPLYDTGKTFRTLQFRPTIKDSGQILYLMPEFVHALNYFMNDTDGRNPCVAGSIDHWTWLALRYKEQLLKPLLPLREQHWCIGFHYLSFPRIYRIALNSDLSAARFNYRGTFNSGAVVEYRCTDTGWVQTQTISEWIE